MQTVLNFPPILLLAWFPLCRFEAQRSLWHGKLGNQVLVPGPRSAAVGLADADYDAKVRDRSWGSSARAVQLLAEW